MDCALLLPSISIFEGAQPIDCVRQSLIALTTGKIDVKNISVYLKKILGELNSSMSDLILDDLLIVIRQSFENGDESIQSILPDYLSKATESRANMLAAVVALNAVVKADPTYTVDERTTELLKSISDELAPQFHSFKLRKSYTVFGFLLSQNEAMSTMLCLIKLSPVITTEAVLEAALYLWHTEPKPSNTNINFLEIVSNARAQIYQGLFKSLPRERFLFLCSDPQVPSTICPSIADKLEDFSDINFFLKTLPIPQLHLDNEAIANAITKIEDCHILTPRLRHQILLKIPTWVNILAKMDESSIVNAAKCFVGNIVDVADSISELLLSLPKITKLSCKFIDEVLNQNTEARSQLSRSEMLAFIISNLQQPPPIEFWQMIYSPEPFKLLEGIDEGKYPVALLGLIHYLIASNRVFKERYFRTITIPSLKDEESKYQLYDYIKSLDGTAETLFGNVPKNDSIILFVANAIYTALSFEMIKPGEIVHISKSSSLPFLVIQLYAIYSIVKSPRYIDSFLVNNQEGIDSLQEAIKSLSDPITDLEELCICSIYDVFMKYHPFYDNPIIVVNILLLSSFIWAHQAVGVSKGINNRFCKSLHTLDQVLIKKPQGNRVAMQVSSVLSRLGKDILPYLLNNADLFTKKKLEISHFFSSPEECVKFCSEFFVGNASIVTIRFFQNCFLHPPPIMIESTEKIESIYRDIVAKEQWEDASHLAGFLSNSGKLEIIKPTATEVIKILVHSRAAQFDDHLPEYLLNLIQFQLRDDDTQLNAMASYFNSVPEVNMIDMTSVLVNFSKFFKGKTDLVSKALSSVFVQGIDPNLPIIRRPEPKQLPKPSKEATDFFLQLVDAVIANPSQKMFIFLRAVIIPYAFLLKDLPAEKRTQLLECCFNAIEGFEALEIKSTNADHFNHIQAAILLFSILVCDPEYTDFFFEYLSEKIDTFTAPRLYVIIHFINALFTKSRFLSAISASYIFKNDLLNKLSESVLRSHEKSKLKESLILAFTSLISKIVSFFTMLKEIDIIDVDECMKTEHPFTTLVPPGIMRSALSLTPVQAFGLFEIAEEKNHFTVMAKTILPPTANGPEFNVKEFITSLKSEFKPAEVDEYIGFLPESIKPDDFRKMSHTERALCLRKNLPRLEFITPPMMRVLLRQPAWVKVCILQDFDALLLPEHYIVLSQVLEEMKHVHENVDLSKLRHQYIEQSFCQDGYFKVVTSVLSQKNLRKEILVDALDNLSKMLSFGPALDKCLEHIAPVLRNTAADDMMLVYSVLMVMTKTGASCEKIYKLLGDEFFIYFLNPKWRNDVERLEYISALVLTFIDKAYHSGFVLPMRILQLICFLYMNRCYKSANQISLYLTDAQKKLISPFINSVFEHLKSSVNNSDEYQIDFMNLCRAYPFLNFDKSGILRKLDFLLSVESPSIDVLGSLINVLLPDEMLEIDEEEEAKNNSECSEAPPINFPLPLSVYNKNPDFWRIVSKHRVTLTKIAHSLRFSKNATSPFKFLFRYPVIVDLQLKVDYYNYMMKKSIDDGSSSNTNATSSSASTNASGSNVHANTSENADTNTNSNASRFEVPNENILSNSVKKITEVPFSEWRKSFAPTIIGSDKDWYTSVCTELFTSDLFILTPNNRCIQINPANHNTDLYKFAGFFVALSLLHNKKLDAHLAPHIFKRILGLPPTLRDVEIVDVALARSYRHILEQSAANLGLFFTATTQDENGKNVEVELIPDGAKTPVKDNNKEKFVNLMMNFRFKNECKQQLDAFVEGFFSITSRKDIQMFNAQELEMLVCGVPKIDIEDMMKNVIILAPYSLEHPLIKKFFMMLKKWDQATLGKLLWFVTGSSELPVGGFETLKKNGLTIQIERGTDFSYTPTAHTCFHTLVIPEYPTLDIMERMFFIALDENI